MTDSAKKHPPKALVWLESSVTTLHLKHMAMLTREMEAKGFEVHVLTSEDTLKQFEKAGGKLTKDGHCTPDSEVNFGTNTHFLPAMPSQTTYERVEAQKIVDDTLTPFEFLASNQVARQRDRDISKAVDTVKPDAIVTSLWPSGYGPFSFEIEGMVDAARRHKPEAKLYSLSSDIPYLDSWHNLPRDKAQDFERVDRTFVRGDGKKPMQRFVPLSEKAKSHITYVGQFVDPLPPRSDMQERKRKVLVTYGTRESDWSGNEYKGYFTEILKAAPFTRISKNPWELVVGKHCPEPEFQQIKAMAEETAQNHNMKITVRRGAPDKAFRQETADAAFRIAQYDIQIMDDVHTGVPALITVGDLSSYRCGRDGSEVLKNLKQRGAHLEDYDQYFLYRTNELVQAINHIYVNARNRPFAMPLDAPAKAATIMASDFHHHAQGAAGHPDPEMKPQAKPTQQLREPEAGQSQSGAGR